MIRRGKAEGWLKLPPESIPMWASLRGIEFNDIHVAPCPGHAERGLALVAETEIENNFSKPLLQIPRDLVLSKELVEEYAKSDKHLRDTLDAVGGFGQSARGAILIFLLIQAMISCPDVDEYVGTKNAFTEYLKFLPMELLPTFWTDSEKDLLKGTSLAPAVDAKTNSLHREFELLRSKTENIPWWQKYWWSETESVLSFDDWRQLDAMYRSRALEFPGIGDSIVPVIDMANHASGTETVAIYEAGSDGSALLLLDNGRKLKQGEEITITYGDEKGACEQIFSYGFLEENLASAKDIFLGLDIPDDDPLRLAKRAFSQCAPGIRLFETSHGIRWESEYIWIICVNEEDGLQFTAAQTNDGDIKLSLAWKDEELNSVSTLKSLLQIDPMWEVYQLRAIAIIQDRVESQLRRLYGTPELAHVEHGEGTPIRDRVWNLASRLRDLETDLLEKAHESLDLEKATLAESETVRQYLAFASSRASSEASSNASAGM